MTRNQIFIILILVGLSTGSSFYLGHSLLKPGQLMPFLGLFFLPVAVARNRLNYDRLALWLGLYILLAFIYNVPGLVKDQVIDFGFIFSTFFVYIAAFLSAKQISRGDKFPAKVLLYLFAGLFLLYFYQIFTDTYIVEGTAEKELYSTTFNNSNDLDAFVVVFIPFILYSLQQWKANRLVIGSVLLLLVVWVLLLGSRFCTLSLFLIPLMYLIFSASYFWKLLLLSGTGTLGVILSQMNWESILQSLTTVENAAVASSASRLYLFLFNFENDKSSSYRVDSYVYAIEHIGDAVFGTGTRNYNAFYQEGFGADSVVSSTPHSYLVENMIAFGWVGLLLVIVMLVTCLIAVYQDRIHRFYGVTTLMLFLMVSFVPSTIIRLPILWFPVFFFTHLSSQSFERYGGWNQEPLEDDGWIDNQDGYSSAYPDAYEGA